MWKKTAHYSTHPRLSTLLPTEWWALNIEDFISQPTRLKCVCCNFLVKLSAVHQRSTICFSNTNLVRRTREADRNNFVWVQKGGWIHFDGCKILSPRLPCYTFHLVNVYEYVKQHNQIKKTLESQIPEAPLGWRSSQSQIALLPLIPVCVWVLSIFSISKIDLKRD